VVQTIISESQTGSIGDGKIFVSEISNVYRIRTGEQDDAAI
jgi:nitrogen regulatory protein PII